MSGLVFIGCEHSGNMARPWAEAGRECVCVDLNPDRENELFPSGGSITYVQADLLTYLPPRREYEFAAFHPVCTNMSGSGARWFKEKGLRGLADGIRLVERCQELAEWMECPYLIENPVGSLSTYWRKPDYIFQPWMFGEMESKATCLWTGGGFVMPESLHAQRPEDVKQSVWRMPPSEDRGRKRSITSEPFARAVFISNRVDAVKHYPMADRDHNEAWIICSCGWGSYGNDGEEWKEHLAQSVSRRAIND